MHYIADFEFGSKFHMLLVRHNNLSPSCLFIKKYMSSGDFQNSQIRIFVQSERRSDGGQRKRVSLLSEMNSYQQGSDRNAKKADDAEENHEEEL